MAALLFWMMPAAFALVLWLMLWLTAPEQDDRDDPIAPALDRIGRVVVGAIGTIFIFTVFALVLVLTPEPAIVLGVRP